MSIDLESIEGLLDRVEESFPRRLDESMGTWARRAFGEGYLNRDELDALLAFCATELPDDLGVEPHGDNAPACEPFVLVNAPAKLKQWRPEPAEPMRQQVLLDGLSCLPGQQDLFD